MNIEFSSDRSRHAIGARIVLVRELSKLKQVAFAKRLGVTQGALSGWESGKRHLGLGTALTICDQFRVSLDFLYTGSVAGLDVAIEHALRALRPPR